MTLMEWWLAFCGILLLGIQSAISPCPLATNIAAISYIGRRVSKPGEVLFSGVLYAIGRALTYFTLSFFVLFIPLFTGDQLTRFFAVSASIFLGPVIILIGMTLIGLVSFSLPGVSGEVSQKIVHRLGIWSALPLGMIFALAFCPVTAAMFLGMLALALTAESRFLFPFLYGTCSALPTIVFAVLIAYHVNFLNRVLSVIQNTDVWMKHIAGCLFIALGIYLTFRYNFAW